MFGATQIFFLFVVIKTIRGGRAQRQPAFRGLCGVSVPSEARAHLHHIQPFVSVRRLVWRLLTVSLDTVDALNILWMLDPLWRFLPNGRESSR